ncbi:MAG: methyltransferase domain-containing protein [Acetatifactor sp.]|nr:methyltransferase domain-containing protein [Acetatifactor sp.]
MGLRFKISTFSFFQTNSRGAELLYETAREYIGGLECRSEEPGSRGEETECRNEEPGGREERPEEGSEGSECRSKGIEDRSEGTKPEEAGATGGIAESSVQRGIVFDLYSGTGTIAQLMAPVSRKVIGVEIVEEAVEAARRNAEENGLNNCEFIAGDVLKVLDSIREKPDLIILDPPRDGIHPKALPKIIDYGVDHIVYISCKPTSLARDLEVFLDSGYTVERAVAVDQFPWTANVETVVKLSLKKDTPKIEVTMEPSAESNYTPTEKATYGKIKEYVKEKHGLNVSSLYIGQIKEKCGIDKRDNYNLPKSENAKVPKCPPEKEAAIMDAFRHFGMI